MVRRFPCNASTQTASDPSIAGAQKRRLRRLCITFGGSAPNPLIDPIMCLLCVWAAPNGICDPPHPRVNGRQSVYKHDELARQPQPTPTSTSTTHFNNPLLQQQKICLSNPENIKSSPSTTPPARRSAAPSGSARPAIPTRLSSCPPGASTPTVSRPSSPHAALLTSCAIVRGGEHLRRQSPAQSLRVPGAAIWRPRGGGRGLPVRAEGPPRGAEPAPHGQGRVLVSISLRPFALFLLLQACIDGGGRFLIPDAAEQRSWAFDRGNDNIHEDNPVCRLNASHM